jgi:acetyl esterase
MTNSLGSMLVLGLLASVAGSALAGAQTPSYPVIVDKVPNGSIKVDPPLPADGKVAAGTVVTVTAVPDAGYALDSVYYSAKGRFGQMFYESMTSPYKVTIDQDKHLGASFIEKSKVDHLKVTQNVAYAKPGVKTLKYDVFSPVGAKNLPCIVIIHGGGWTTNTEDIMRGMARELTRSRKYVVFSIDYRWAAKGDGDATNNTMANLIEDVYGAIAHIQEHAAEYGADPTRIAVTGDSAGGHLSAAAINLADKIGKGGFGKAAGVFEFLPTYLPKGKTVEQVKTAMVAAIRVAAPSYGVFGGSLLNHYSDDPAANDQWKDAIAPQSNIPTVKDRAVPQYLLRGTLDGLIKDEAVKAYVDTLVKAGQRVEYVQVGGASHAFFDWKPDERTKATFAKYGVFYCAEMEAFFNSVFYAAK